MRSHSLIERSIRYNVVPVPRPAPSEITAMLKAWSKGEAAPASEVFPLLYEELRKQAHSFLRRERPGHTLQTTALINETYIKLREQRAIEWESRVYAELGENDEAIRWLIKGYADRAFQMMFAGVDPWLSSLHGHPGYHDLLRRIGLVS